MASRKDHKLIIQGVVILAFIFAIMVAWIANQTGSLTLGLIFLTTLQVVVLLAILYMLETIVELLEAK